jgi:hypothetical protein
VLVVFCLIFSEMLNYNVYLFKDDITLVIASACPDSGTHFLRHLDEVTVRTQLTILFVAICEHSWLETMVTKEFVDLDTQI